METVGAELREIKNIAEESNDEAKVAANQRARRCWINNSVDTYGMGRE